MFKRNRLQLAVGLVVVQLAAICGAMAADPLRIDGPKTSDPYKLVTLSPKGDVVGAAVIWDVMPEDKADVVELPDGRLILTGPPGTYTARLRIIRLVEGKTVSESARHTFTIGGKAPPGPDGKPQTMAPACIGRLRVGSSGCTATPIYPRRADGRWDVLTASHCTGGVGSKGTLTLKDGREIALTVTARQTGPDITWFVTERADMDDLPYGVLAASDPPPGTAVWQAGYGTNQPTVRKDGTARGQADGGQLAFDLSVSHGDSGGPIFRADTNEIVACVCCTKGIGIRTDMWGGSATTAARIRPGSVELPVLDSGEERHAGCIRPILTIDK